MRHRWLASRFDGTTPVKWECSVCGLEAVHYGHTPPPRRAHGMLNCSEHTALTARRILSS